MAINRKPGPGGPAWKMKKWLRRHPEDRVVAEEKQPEPPGGLVHEPSPAVKATKKKAAKKKTVKKKASAVVEAVRKATKKLGSDG